MGIFDIFKKKSNTESLNLHQDGQPIAIQNSSVKAEDFKKIYDEIEAETAVKTIELSLDDKLPELTESKIGGIPYLPHTMEIPLDSNGIQMKLLAQIDCKELTALEDFPHMGLLQFFCSDDDVSGLNFDDFTKQTGFRILYHESIDTSVTRDDVLKKIIPSTDESYFPVKSEHSVKFTVETQTMPNTDYRYDQLFIKKYNENHSEKIVDRYRELYCDEYDNLFDDESNGGNKIGGYPFFTQEDPRDETGKYTNYDVLLLQLDSDFEDIEWGDAGVCNFFINREKLKNKDFSDVLYNWDCL